MNQKEKSSGIRIDKNESLTIGGITQWISLRSANIKNPILLFLHGGPGTAQISFTRKSQKKVGRHLSSSKLGPERIGQILLTVTTKRRHENRTFLWKTPRN